MNTGVVKGTVYRLARTKFCPYSPHSFITFIYSSVQELSSTNLRSD